MDYRMVKEVHKRVKPSTKILKVVMIVLCVLFMLFGIVFDRGMLFLALLMAGMYFLYDAYVIKDYEYVMEGNTFTISVIHAKRRRREEHVLDLKDMEVLAPNWHEAVAKYRLKGGTEKIPKYDYTSYEPEIPYYTMIIVEGRKKIKLLLDLEEDMLFAIKRMYPKKVFVQKLEK
ncbi:hypothetical protein [Sporofaciens sp. SGI.106]|uniref:hypothetical protein n=1 Tax=Sporofaciens sp. SGI.106 TaxID=3420568 RepID=UPI003D09426D